ncbi:hypothetical protein [Marinicella meishanensis]|uniref:hypothetical protein n=1 Tax=Marinicella meishanensis TaxID=2873263 RepID=UPI001CBD907B|nr:hypothetical protein [Marinicella sp. NBU2979]
MFESNATSGSDTGKKIRYEPIERRRRDRRSAVSDRRTEERADSDRSDRRQKSDRRKK